jgi:hypothetical protein
MNYWTKHITNKLILLNKKLDNYETFKLISLMIIMLVVVIFISQSNLYGLILGIGILLMIIYYFRMLIIQDEIGIDFSIYDIPEEGEIITFIKKKTFDSFTRPIFKTSITSYGIYSYIKMKVVIEKGDEYKVQKVIWGSDVISLQIVSVKDDSDDCVISFLETNRFWKSKRNIRNDKINKLLNN